MAPHQKEREQGGLLLEATTMIEAMRDLLKENCFWTANRPEFNRQGYSLMTRDETAIRDINYRDEKLYPTSDEAIDAAVAIMWEDGKV
jgi:hypothetical protein